MRRRREDINLFSEASVSAYVEQMLSHATEEAKSLSADKFESNPNNQIIDHIVSKYHITPLNVKDEQKVAKLDEVDVDVSGDPNRSFMDTTGGPFLLPGYKTTWTIPVSGTLELFKYHPSAYPNYRVLGELRGDGNLVLYTESPSDVSDEESIKKDLETQLSQIKSTVDNVNKTVENYKAELRSRVSIAVTERKSELNKIIKIKKALKIELEPKKDANPASKTQIDVQAIMPLSTNKEDSGPYISTDHYEIILNAIRNIGASMESTRAADSKDEEGLRDIILAGLSASMSSGSAGGELFRKSGKTDISIVFENKAAFIAECKIWRGEEYIIEGIDQILGYLTWRDAKTSIVIFNRHNKNFSDIQKQVKLIFSKHQSFVRETGAPDGEWRFVLQKPDDDGRQIVVHVYLFDVLENNGSSNEK